MPKTNSAGPQQVPVQSAPKPSASSGGWGNVPKSVTQANPKPVAPQAPVQAAGPKPSTNPPSPKSVEAPKPSNAWSSNQPQSKTWDVPVPQLTHKPVLKASASLTASSEGWGDEDVQKPMKPAIPTKPKLSGGCINDAPAKAKFFGSSDVLVSFQQVGLITGLWATVCI